MNFEIDAALDASLYRPFASRGDALAGLMTAATLINQAWQEESSDLGSLQSGVTAVMGQDSRLRKWLERLLDAASKAAADFGAADFSVSVGFPAGVSVSLTWPRSDEQDCSS